MADPITTFSVRRGKTGGTPGPWEVVERSDTWNVKAGNRCIARLQKKTGAETDAHNIAALPDLLEALGCALKQLEILEWSGDYNTCPSCGKTDPSRMEYAKFDESAFGHTKVYQCPVERAIEVARALQERGD